jgi:hypothetical protein
MFCCRDWEEGFARRSLFGLHLKAFQFLNANLPQKDTTLKNAWISGGGYVLQKMDYKLPIDRCCL